MLESDAALVAATEAKQFNAVAKLIELRSRLHGLLIDKHEITVEEKPSMAAAMELARARIERIPLYAEFRTIDEAAP